MITRTIAALIGAVALGALLTPVAEIRAQQPAPRGAKSGDAFTSSTTFRHEGLIFVDTKVNGKGPYNFLFDSGASMSMLSTRLSKELGLKTKKSPMPAQGVGTQEMDFAIVDTLRVADFEREEIVVGVMDLDHISGELGKHMHGIIGQNMIKYMRKTVFDFPTSTLEITRYRKGEGPQFDFEELALKMLIKGGLELPGLPGLPGEEPDEDPPARPDKPAPKPDDDEEQFSTGPQYGTFSDPPPASNVTFAYRHLEVMGLMEVAMWFVDLKLNGRKHTLFFDTGASTLCVLSQSAAKGLGVHTSFEYPVKGVGQSSASEGILESMEIGGYKISEPTCSVMALDQLLGQLEMVGGECHGIVGLTLATRFKRMIVDGESKRVTLQPYGKDEPNPYDPVPYEGLMKKAVISTWNNKASKLGFIGDTVLLDDWEKLKLADGGMRVEKVDGGGAAEKAGLKAGDIITAVVGVEKDDDGKPQDMPVRGIAGLIAWACTIEPGTEITLCFNRGGESKELKFKLEAYPFSGKFPDKYRLK